jgi:hypothetical protein
LARPSQGGEKMTAVWVSRHEDLVSHEVVSPHVCDTYGYPSLLGGARLGKPNGSAGVACRDAVAQAQRAERAADGGVVDVSRALAVSPRAPRIHAQRVARFAPYNTRNCLPPKKLRREIQ